MDAPVKTRKMVDSDRPMITQKPQNRACRVAVENRLAPRLMAKTKPSGARMITHLSGVAMTSAAMPERANSSATMPESSTPEAM